MKKALLAVVILIFCWNRIEAQIRFPCEGQAYMTLTDHKTSDLVRFSFSHSSGAVSLVPVFDSLDIVINAVGYRNADNLIYGINPADYTLYQIDAAGVVRELAVLPLDAELSYVGADITMDGKYLVIVGGAGDVVDGRDMHLARVDLESPAYDILFIGLTGPSTRMLDIAFDPLTGILYGFDSSNQRLVRVDDGSGEIFAPFPSSDLLVHAGSLFFNAFGDLFAYGSQDGFEQNTLIRIDKGTGAFTLLTVGPDARGTDGCSCPYTIDMQKSVNPRSSYPCARVSYVFTIVNASFSTHGGIRFKDVLPPGFVVDEIIRNPFGGDLVSGLGSGQLVINNMVIPPGIDSLVVRAAIGNVASGTYNNQAVLTNLPTALGGERFSDDPSTFIRGDSTTLQVNEFTADTLFLEASICRGDSLILDVSMYGLSYVWEDQAGEGEFIVSEPGTYMGAASSICDTSYVVYRVNVSSVELSLSASQTEIVLGDTITLESGIVDPGDEVTVLWTDPLGSSIFCVDCPSTIAVPFDDVHYMVRATNEAGCTDTASVMIRVQKDFHYFIPNIFTPNGDGRNDMLTVYSRTQATLAEFRIFDRWGNLVFERRDVPPNEPSIGWDGTLNGNGQLMSPGVYVYRVVLLFPDGSERIIQGGVTLIR